SKYEKGQQISSFFQQSLERVSALPGVKAAGVASNLPLGQGFGSRYFAIEGRPPQPPGQGYNANTCLVTPGYFSAMRIPLIRGRDFTNADTYGTAEAVVINEEMARQFWPDEDPLGQRLRVGEGPWRTIIGVVGSVKNRGLDAEPRQEMYWPYYQGAIPFGTFVVRTESNPEAMTGAIRNAIGEIDKDQPLSDIRSLEQVMSESVAPRRFNMLLLAVFAGVALLLAAIGLYGVISYSVTQRTHEMGVRMALGARPADVMKLVVGQGLVLTGIGIGLGLAGAYFLTRLMASLLFGVNATDLSVFVAIPALLALVALVASIVPALRAVRVDPMIALRSE
ncbi:MAG TPA: FtsX-like permease family protein, partial [Blastocatellia bacterium]|nr:FtsX-like permease family protein [Blastocatellia bacterium]